MSSSSGLHVLMCALPKAGNSPSEYEDAAAEAALEEGPGWRHRFAVADGATESSFAKLWAELLVQGYIDREQPLISTAENLSVRLKPLQEQWQRTIDERELSWYAQERVRQGAFAALVGLELRQEVTQRAHRNRIRRTWQVVAVGDCCVLIVRGDSLTHAIPVKHSVDFSNRPQLLSSRAAVPDGCAVISTGEWQSGDTFFLMSDALAAWFLQKDEQHERPWRLLLDLLLPRRTGAGATNGGENMLVGDCQERFESLIRDLRTQPNGLRNDDVTLTIVQTEQAVRV